MSVIRREAVTCFSEAAGRVSEKIVFPSATACTQVSSLVWITKSTAGFGAGSVESVFNAAGLAVLGVRPCFAGVLLRDFGCVLWPFEVFLVRGSDVSAGVCGLEQDWCGCCADSLFRPFGGCGNSNRRIRSHHDQNEDHDRCPRDGCFFVYLPRRSLGNICDLRNVIDGFLRSGGSDVIGHGLFLVDAEELGIGANESLVEDAAGEEIEFLVLEALSIRVLILVAVAIWSSEMPRSSR